MHFVFTVVFRILLLPMLGLASACGTDAPPVPSQDSGRADVPSRDAGDLDVPEEADGGEDAAEVDAGACAMSCDGCCDGEECFAGRTRSACGIGGEACFACRSAVECVDAICRADADDIWHLVVVSAVLDELNGNGGTYDEAGDDVAPDPYVEVLDPSGSQSSSRTVRNSVMPEWDEMISLRRSTTNWIGSSVRVRLYDADVGRDELIIESTINVTGAQIAAASFDLEVPRDAAAGQAGATITFRFDRR